MAVRLRIPAASLRIGDIVLTALNGERAHAVFDVAHDLDPGRAVVWTALGDQARGVPEFVGFDAAEEVCVERDGAGPRTGGAVPGPHGWMLR